MKGLMYSEMHLQLFDAETGEVSYSYKKRNKVNCTPRELSRGIAFYKNHIPTRFADPSNIIAEKNSEMTVDVIYGEEITTAVVSAVTYTTRAFNAIGCYSSIVTLPEPINSFNQSSRVRVSFNLKIKTLGRTKAEIEALLYGPQVKNIKIRHRPNQYLHLPDTDGSKYLHYGNEVTQMYDTPTKNINRLTSSYDSPYPSSLSEWISDTPIVAEEFSDVGEYPATIQRGKRTKYLIAKTSSSGLLFLEKTLSPFGKSWLQAGQGLWVRQDNTIGKLVFVNQTTGCYWTITIPADAQLKYTHAVMGNADFSEIYALISSSSLDSSSISYWKWVKYSSSAGSWEDVPFDVVDYSAYIKVHYLPNGKLRMVASNAWYETNADAGEFNFTKTSNYGHSDNVVTYGIVDGAFKELQSSANSSQHITIQGVPQDTPFEGWKVRASSQATETISDNAPFYPINAESPSFNLSVSVSLLPERVVTGSGVVPEAGNLQNVVLDHKVLYPGENDDGDAVAFRNQPLVGQYLSTGSDGYGSVITGNFNVGMQRITVNESSYSSYTTDITISKDTYYGTGVVINTYGTKTTKPSVTSSVPTHFVKIGDESAKTGTYNPKFVTCRQDPANSITIDGKPARIIHETTGATSGSVLLLPFAGGIFFHPSDVGKQFTYSLNVAYNPDFED